MKRIRSNVAPVITRLSGADTPCAKTGFCADCNSPDRVCRVTTIMERRPRFADVRVLVVDEDLGF